MRVTLFTDIQAEGFVSMNIYAKQLGDALQKKESNLDLITFSVEMPNLPGPLRGLNRFIGRYLLYPLKLQKVKSPINHIADHSYGFLSYFLPRKSCVITCHDLAPLFAKPDSIGFFLKKELWKIALRGTIRAAYLIADSENTRRDLLRYAPQLGNRVQVLYPGLDHTVFRVLRNEDMQVHWEQNFRQTHQIDPDSLIILHVGSYSPRKNFEGLIKVIAALQTRLQSVGGHNTVHFLQIGGVFTDKHKTLLNDLNLTDITTQIVFMPAADLPRAYNMATALLFPSYYEGFGWPPLEAMACGTPVVASNVASLPEVMGDAGLLFAPDDFNGMAMALLDLIEDQNFRETLIAKGLEQSKKFSWQQYTDELYNIYQKLYNA